MNVKMLGPVARYYSQLGRNVVKTGIRNSSHLHGGVPGENLPFDIYNKTRFTINLFLFVGSGIAAPFLIVLHQLNKK